MSHDDQNTTNEPRAQDPSLPTGAVFNIAHASTTILDELLFASRWVLYPLNIGLLIGLTIHVLSFGWQVADLVLHAHEHIKNAQHGSSELMVQMVGLLDQAMIASLLIVTIMGGHQIYVRRFRERRGDDAPGWLDHIDTYVLKVKVGLAFVGVSSVVLLQDCVSATAIPTDVWVQHIAIHMTFLCTTLIVAWVWRMMHPRA